MVRGRLVSAKSKTGDPQCSEAMSTWQNARRGNPVSMALEVAFSILGKCRAKARALKQAAGHRGAGSEARAQALEHRATSGGPVTAKERLAKARELRASRAAAQPSRPAAKAAPAPKPLHEQAMEAARRVPAEKRFGSKVFVHHAWQEYRKGGGKLGLSEFKSGLAGSPEARMQMSRADLVQGMRRGDVKGSKIPYMGGEYNFIKVGEAGTGSVGAKLRPRPESAYSGKPPASTKAAELVAKVRAARQPPGPSLREQAAAGMEARGRAMDSLRQDMLTKAHARTSGAMPIRLAPPRQRNPVVGSRTGLPASERIERLLERARKRSNALGKQEIEANRISEDARIKANMAGQWGQDNSAQAEAARRASKMARDVSLKSEGYTKVKNLRLAKEFMDRLAKVPEGSDAYRRAVEGIKAYKIRGGKLIKR